MGKKWKSRTFIIPIVLALIVSIFVPFQPGYAAEKKDGNQQDLLEPTTVMKTSYEEYLAKVSDGGRKPAVDIVIDEQNLLDREKYETIRDFEGQAGTSVVSPEEGTMKWDFDVPEAGLYNVQIDYYPYKGKGMNIERELKINGEIPFRNAQYLSFSRVWKDANKVKKDANQNEIRPSQVEEPRWQTTYFSDYLGYVQEPLYFHFNKGKNSIELKAIQDTMLIRSLKLTQYEETPTYADVQKVYQANHYQKVKLDQEIKIQAEAAAYKSDPMLYPTFDRSTPATEPSHPTKIRLNTIGGDTWKRVGQWLTWEVDVPESGLYEIGMKYWQNLKSGSYAARSLKIDGKIPFKEMENISFNYDAAWQIDKLHGKDPYLFYLEKGKHEIRLDVSLGALAETISTVETDLIHLNEAYREMLMIIGSTPDPFRDYQLAKRTPEALKKLKEAKESLAKVSADLTKKTAKKGVTTATLDTLVIQLDQMVQDPKSIKDRWKAFQNNLSSLGAWVLSMQENPLQLDYLFLTSSQLETPTAGANIFASSWYSTRSFVGSFFEDYSSLGGETDKNNLTVWVASRDYGNILNSLVKNYFENQTGIHVNVEIVDAATLLPATLAGQGPDVALGVPISSPVNYAIRNALVDVSQLTGYEDVEARFSPSAVLPYRLNGGVFALPETQTFPMMFYRKDIFEELGIQKPETWADLYEIMPYIQKNQMNIGIPINGVTGTGAVAGVESTLSSYTMFLYQNGGRLYSDNGAATKLESPEAVKAFKDWTSLFVDYSIPVLYDFANRFRTGEMPIGIADYSTFNYLSVFAPELKGLWEMAPVPGTMQPDGTINRSVSSSGTAAIMLKASKKQQEAWEFMKWWTSADIQAKFGNELESIIGVAARYATANQEAVEILGWPSAVYRNLENQWKWVEGNPEVPGAYFTSRHIENAFRRVYNDLDDPRETILDYKQLIDREITNKRKEFGLHLEE
ncbi:CUT1 family carbohydrate ABC transporter substrate-binding protein [Neobacillus bataviensis LMG 21833]|uniref:CUT1 family carbohydrate ABC transporter substrate-binding protein n=1 Tax=Neobacillus bataviensis LMG 21833 TaxID=1117379 RepID=K6DAV3_9BACI|nr:extracellular solute-binding protein [Neobacillus bataviensis]EKN65203.1 CUT1 family carbohydrate ABC transporter substrate-binding protein [Neobacillus bataviensis LMG 21833]